MAEYLIQGETLTSMADKIRILSGTSGEMTTAVMDSSLGEANTAVGNQSDLIDQIAAALEGKSAASGVELPELTNPGAAANLLTGTQLIDQEGNIVDGSMPNNGAVSATLNLDTTSYTPAQGYHSGSGKVQVDSSINTTVDTQADLIAQIQSEHETQIAAIKTALEGKAAGVGVETCTVTFTGTSGPNMSFDYINDGKIEQHLYGSPVSGSSFEVIKTFIIVNEFTSFSLSESSLSATGGAELTFPNNAQGSLALVDLLNAGSEVTIEYTVQ